MLCKLTAILAVSGQLITLIHKAIKSYSVVLIGGPTRANSNLLFFFIPDRSKPLVPERMAAVDSKPKPECNQSPPMSATPVPQVL